MALTEALTIRRIGPEAIAGGCALTAEVDWNQTAEDWGFFLTNGTVFGAHSREGRLVATAATLPYSAGFAWISLVIVSRSHRGHGLGVQLLNECIALLRAGGMVGVLDATPAGEKMYAPLGFKPLLGLNRWKGSGNGFAAGSKRVRSLARPPAGDLGKLDAMAFGSDRGTLLADFMRRADTRTFQLDDGTGYAMVRRGRIASHVGPVIAANERDAVVLIEAAVTTTAGLVMLDVPDAWTGIATWLREHGFEIQRPLLRMALGRDRPLGEPSRVFAIAGPEYG
jgi:GNAT superfamily N-acetyltransferase